MKKVFLVCAIAALALSSCSNDNEPAMRGNGNLRVYGSISQAISRATETSFEDNDAIGVSQKESTENQNVNYTYASGQFASLTGIKVTEGTTPSFTAYYPYAEDLAADGVINFTTPVDYLWAESTASVSGASASVAFSFAHKMSKLNITYKQEDNALDADATISVGLANVVVAGSFNTKTGVVTASSEKTTVSATDITLGDSKSWILPAQGGGFQLTIAVGSKTYVATVSNAVNAGYQHNYTVTIKAGSLQVNTFDLVLSSEEISGFTTSDGGGLDAEEEIIPNTLEVGDFLLADGTVIDKNDDLTGKSVAAVVYYVGNPGDAKLTADMTTVNGLALALNNANTTAVRFNNSVNFNYSSQEGLDDYVLSDFNASKVSTSILGYNNTAVLKYVFDNNGTFNGPTEVNALTNLSDYQSAHAVLNASNWYLPSMAEWTAIVSNYDAIQASMIKAGGSLAQFTEFEGKETAAERTEMFYWTSTLRGNSNSWVSPAVEVANNDILSIARNSNNYKGFFRFAIAF